MVQWLIELLRNTQADCRKALSAVEEAAGAELREALADYDAFVPTARAQANGLLLGTARSSAGEEIPLRLGWDDAAAHWLVQGGTGTGKTTWVASIFRQALDAGRPFGVIDCKGDLFETALHLTAAIGRKLPPADAAKLRERLVVINPFGDDLVPFNVCRPIQGFSAEVQAYEVTLALGRLFDTALGLHMENILRHLVLLLIESGLSLVEAPEILQDEVLRGVLANRSVNPAVKDFFLGAWPALPQASKDALLSRLHGLLLPENLRLMLGADDLLDIRQTFDEGQILLVFLGKGPGVPEEQVHVLGSLLVQRLFQATYGRLRRERNYLLAADEFFHLLEAPSMARRFETALTTSRSFGLSLLLIHHNFAQLPTALREIILGNCDLTAIFRTGGRSAEHFGEFLPDADPEILARLFERGGRKVSRDELHRHQLEAVQRLPNRTFYWYDRRQPYRAVRVTALDVPSPHGVAGMRKAELDRLISTEGWERGQAALSRSTLRSQIEARRKRLRDVICAPIRVRDRQDSDPNAVKPLSEEGQPTKTTVKKRRPRLG